MNDHEPIGKIELPPGLHLPLRGVRQGHPRQQLGRRTAGAAGGRHSQGRRAARPDRGEAG